MDQNSTIKYFFDAPDNFTAEQGVIIKNCLFQLIKQQRTGAGASFLEELKALLAVSNISK